LETTFEIDANGILSVSAKDLGTGISQKITINNLRGRLSEEQIQKMIKEAEENKEADALTKKRINAVQGLKHYMDSVRNVLKDMDANKSQRLTPEERTVIDQALKEATTWYEANQHNAELVDIEHK
jgi:heat shock protein 5